MVKSSWISRRIALSGVLVRFLMRFLMFFSFSGWGSTWQASCSVGDAARVQSERLTGSLRCVQKSTAAFSPPPLLSLASRLREQGAVVLTMSGKDGRGRRIDASRRSTPSVFLRQSSSMAVRQSKHQRLVLEMSSNEGERESVGGKNDGKVRQRREKMEGSELKQSIPQNREFSWCYDDAMTALNRP